MKQWNFSFLKICILSHLISFSPMTSLVPPFLSHHFPVMSSQGKMQVMHWLTWNHAHANWLAAHTRWLTSRLLPSTAYNGWVFLTFPPCLLPILDFCPLLSHRFSEKGQKENEQVEKLHELRCLRNANILGTISLCFTTLLGSLLLPNLLRREQWGGCYRIFL